MGSALLVTRPELFHFTRDALHSHDTLYAYAATRTDAQPLEGRGATYRVSTPHGEWVVRRYRRGGAVASVLGDRYVRLGQPRPLRELIVSAAARERGIRTPEVMALGIHPSRWFLRADLATAYVPDSEDLAQLGFGQTQRSRADQLAAFEAAAALVAELASAGLAHADLNLKNILIKFGAGRPEAWVLDLDRARIGRASAGSMHARLERSLNKWERNTGRALAPEFRAALLAHRSG
ncbi:MAG: lipopolysaccharide kinase InaA family protein [Gemmatimonadota bacterium]